VDNLPVALLPKFLEFQIETGSEISKIALVMDLREEAFLAEYKDVLSRLRSQGYEFDIIFLEASDEALLRRYSQTRRQHPIATGGKTLLEGIRAEKGALDELKEIANKVIDTSTYNVHALKDVIVNHVLKSGATGAMHAQVLSFGYKYGIPYDADLVFDVRFLPNPYFIPDLKELNGEDPAVRSYVLQWDETTIFLKKMFDLFDYLVPLYEKEGKSYLTIAFGCTGGKHRSVTISAEIYKRLEQKINYISLKHRDIELG